MTAESKKEKEKPVSLSCIQIKRHHSIQTSTQILLWVGQQHTMRQNFKMQCKHKQSSVNLWQERVIIDDINSNPGVANVIQGSVLDLLLFMIHVIDNFNQQFMTASIVRDYPLLNLKNSMLTKSVKNYECSKYSL